MAKKSNNKKKKNKKNIESKNNNQTLKKGNNNKKNEKMKIEETITKSSDLKKIIILIIIILVSFGVFYIITLKLNKSNHDDIFKKEELGNTEIQYDEIIVGTILKQNPKTYYVLIMDNDDNNINKYNNILSQYTNYEYDYKIYTVDLNNPMNKNSKADENSFDKDDLKFKGTVLLKISDKEIEETYESDKITDKLNELLDEVQNK